MTHIIHRSMNTAMPVAKSGRGAYLYDENGKEYLDASGGAAVSCLGHGHRAPIEAIQKQVESLAYVHSGFFTSQPAEQLADKLVALCPEAFGGVILVAGGSEAIESAMKLARQYFVESGESSRKYFVSRKQSFHGNTIGALSVGNHEGRKLPYNPILLPSHAVSPCYPYRDQLPQESEEQYAMRLAKELEQKLLELGSENVIGFVAETVGGATGGVLPPVKGYLRNIRQVCDDYGILLILDEVMCGCGRTGTFFSFDHDGVIPDIVTIAKGLGAGYQPIGAVLCSERIRTTLNRGSGELAHGFTYMGHAASSAAALAVLETIEKDKLLENVQKQGDYLINQLRERFANHPNVGDIRGRGLFIGIEFVADRQSKQPMDPAFAFNAHLKRLCLRHGMLVYPGGGTIDGFRGDHVMLAPPYIVDHTTCDKIIDILSVAIDECLAECVG